MKQVAQSEHDLLTVTQALVGEGGYAAIAPLVETPRPLPARLGSTAMRLLEETLARGIVLELARRGGWRRARHVGPAGRLWERHDAGSAAPVLRFTGLTIEILRWLSSGQAAAVQPVVGLAVHDAPSLGDSLVAYLALDLLQARPAAAVLAAQPAVRVLPLLQLGFVDLLGATAADWRVLVAHGALVLEALQQDLARRWLAMERQKPLIQEPAAMQRLGDAQATVLHGFLDAIDRASRRDLAGFMIEAGLRLFARPPAASAWIASLTGTGTLAERSSARAAAGAFLHALTRLSSWDDEHRERRFIDDGYDAAQLMLALYEPFRLAGARDAQAVLRALLALEVAAPAAESRPA